MDKRALWSAFRGTFVKGVLLLLKKSGGVWAWLAGFVVDFIFKPLYDLAYRKAAKKVDQTQGKEQAKDVRQAKTPDEVRRAVDNLD